ncbi:MAG: maltose alpha-D-glucosyltransferase [bacterium]
MKEESLWYKDAIIYQTHVKCFYDSNNDGIGDFKGLTEKLDYLENLGVNAIWLLPFYPSPLKDDGYDISDFYNLNKEYGTLHDFRVFLNEAHKRGIRIITELVVNHTSDQHMWFKRARESPPGSLFRNYYVWSDSVEKYKEARIIFQDFEKSNWAWDPELKQYYWHRFFFHQPDLNYNNPAVQKAIFRVIEHWMNMGVDGMRLDAVPYLFEREGTNCENLPETYAFLRKLRSFVDSKYQNKMLLGEANQWPEDAAQYFGSGDMCHMAFHFPLMPRMYMALWMENRFPIIDILEQTPQIPDTAQWAIFLRNHDELTLEMVTDEERDYMYRVYAKDPAARINLGIRRRLAPLLGNSRRKIELMNMLLFSFPGTPIIYYGDEIGMGDNYYLGDRNGVRTPMQWSADKSAGFSRANPQRLYSPIIIDPEYHYEAVNVENQEKNPSSLLWWMRRMIAMRKRYKAFSRGSMEFLLPQNPNILAFIRSYNNEHILVIVNLSRFSQVTECELSKFVGYMPQDVFSKNFFPVIKESPYLLMMGPHDYYWFHLRKVEEPVRIGEEETLPELAFSVSWESIFLGKSRDKLEGEILPKYLDKCRWFSGKALGIQRIQISDHIPISKDADTSYLLILEVLFRGGLPVQYVLPISFAHKEMADLIVKEYPQSAIALMKGGESEGLLYDAMYDEEFRKALLNFMAQRKRIHTKQKGVLVGYAGAHFKENVKEIPLGKSLVLKGEQSNTSVLYGNELFFKLYRKLDEGENPDLELSKFITERTSFTQVPPFAGAIEFRKPGVEPIAIGMLQGLVTNQGDLWKNTLDFIGRYYEAILSQTPSIAGLGDLPQPLTPLSLDNIPENVVELIGRVYLELAARLGTRTAELHKAFASDMKDPDFMPESFTRLYQRSLFQSMQSLAKKGLELLKNNLAKLSEEMKESAREVLLVEKKIISEFKQLLSKDISVKRIRIHGDLHLGQVLFTGNDVIFIDFEGEPARSISQRRSKHSAIKDVAGIMRSFHYASYSELFRKLAVEQKDRALLLPWAEVWYMFVSGVYLHAYRESVKGASFVPADDKEFMILLRAFMLEKAVYELMYELNNRPRWVDIPLYAIKQLVKE